MLYKYKDDIHANMYHYNTKCNDKFNNIKIKITVYITYYIAFEGWYLSTIMEKIYTIRRKLLYQIQRCSSKTARWETYSYS